MDTDQDMIDISESPSPPPVSPNHATSLEMGLEDGILRIRAALFMLPSSNDMRLRAKFLEGLALEYVSK
jgi:hypothetical protein